MRITDKVLKERADWVNEVLEDVKVNRQIILNFAYEMSQVNEKMGHGWKSMSGFGSNKETMAYLEGMLMGLRFMQELSQE